MLSRKSIVALALTALSVAACENNKSTDTTPQQPVTNTNATVTATPETRTPPAPQANANPIATASNASDVKQFADQTKMSSTQVPITTTAATIRTEPLGHDEVLVAKQGLMVTEVARRGDYILVLFNEPNDSTKQKAGWVYKDSLESYAAPATAMNEKNEKNEPKSAAGAKTADKATSAAAKLTCAAGQARLETDHAFCGNTCKDDGDCKKLDGVCDGNGKMVSMSGQMVASHYCVATDLPSRAPITAP